MWGGVPVWCGTGSRCGVVPHVGFGGGFGCTMNSWECDSRHFCPTNSLPIAIWSKKPGVFFMVFLFPGVQFLRNSTPRDCLPPEENFFFGDTAIIYLRIKESHRPGRHPARFQCSCSGFFYVLVYMNSSINYRMAVTSLTQLPHGFRCGVGRDPGVVWDGVPVWCGTGSRCGVGR